MQIIAKKFEIVRTYDDGKRVEGIADLVLADTGIVIKGVGVKYDVTNIVTCELQLPDSVDFLTPCYRIAFSALAWQTISLWLLNTVSSELAQMPTVTPAVQ